MELPDELLFASDAELASLWGAAFVALALICLLLERRQRARTAINRVGWVPWTGLFLACVVLALGLPGMLRG